MMLGVIAASMYSLSSKKASEEFDAATVTCMMAFEGAICFISSPSVRDTGFTPFLTIFQDPETAGHLLFLSVFCAFASYFCYNRFLNYVDAALGNNIVSSLSTIIGVVAGILVMGGSLGLVYHRGPCRHTCRRLAVFHAYERRPLSLSGIFCGFLLYRNRLFYCIETGCLLRPGMRSAEGHSSLRPGTDWSAGGETESNRKLVKWNHKTPAFELLWRDFSSYQS